MKCPSIDYLLNGREDINWILDLEDEVHLIWDLWIYLSGLPECKGNDFLKVRRAGRKSGFLFGQLPLPESTSPEKIMGGRGTPPWCHLGGCTKQIYIKQMMTKPSL